MTHWMQFKKSLVHESEWILMHGMVIRYKWHTAHSTHTHAHYGRKVGGSSILIVYIVTIFFRDVELPWGVD